MSTQAKQAEKQQKQEKKAPADKKQDKSAEKNPADGQKKKIDGVMRKGSAKSEKFRQLNDLGLGAADIQKVFKQKGEKEPHYSHVYGVLRKKWGKEKKQNDKTDNK